MSSRRGFKWRLVKGRQPTRGLLMHSPKSVSQTSRLTVIPLFKMRIDREEGFKALFKGGPARIIRSSPQFGFTLVAYEYLHKVRTYVKYEL